MTRYRARRALRIVVVSLTGAAMLAFGGTAVADDGAEESEQPPGYEEPETPEVDSDAAGLMLGDGATLAEPEVLDIKFVTEDLGTGETEEEDSGETGTSGGSTGGSGDEGDEGEDEDDSSGQESDSGGQREEWTGGQHKFTLQTDVLFEKNSSQLSGDARDALADVAAAIDEYHPTEVNIFGFTDDLGSYEHGLTLSKERAQNTQDVLLDLIEDPAGISFNVRGYSEDYPLYDNSTEDGRAKNRRVEISWPTGD